MDHAEVNGRLYYQSDHEYKVSSLSWPRSHEKPGNKAALLPTVN